MLYWFLFIKRNSESINWDINKGYKCYTCKKDVDSFDERFNRVGQSIFTPDDFNNLETPVRCTSCKREIALNQLTKKFGFRYRLLANLDTYLVKGNYTRFMFISLSIIMACLILDLFFREGRVFFYIGQLAQLIYWIIFIRKYKLTTIKKPNQ